MQTGRTMTWRERCGIGMFLSLSLGCAASKAPQPSPSTIESPGDASVEVTDSTGDAAGETGPDKDLLGHLQRQLVGMEPGGPQILYTLIPETRFSAEDWSTWDLDGSWVMDVHGGRSLFVELSMDHDQLVLHCVWPGSKLQWTFRGSVQPESGHLVLVDEESMAPIVSILNLMHSENGTITGAWLDLDEEDEEEEERYVAVVLRPEG